MAARPKPQDHLPKKSAAEASADGPYTFTGLDGEEYELPGRDKMNAGIVRRNRHLDEMDMAFTIIEELVDDEATMAALDALPMERFNAVMMGWQASLGTNPGK